MSNILLLDTAYGTRVALKKGEECFYNEELALKGSETVMPLIDGILKRAALKASELDAIGACVGPGSFTGVRIGLATVKSLCYALDKQTFAFTSTELMAYNNKDTALPVTVLCDAGNGVYYLAEYSKGVTEVLRAPECVSEETAKAFLKNNADNALSCDGASAKKFGGKAYSGKTELFEAISRARFIAESELLPLYIRKPQPERGVGDL